MTEQPLDGTRSLSERSGFSDPVSGKTGISGTLFEAAQCRNCGASLKTAYCAKCGQKKVDRLSLRHLLEEAWEKIRWFEADTVRSALKVMFRPGLVAREYVFGRRKGHTHPLKLLLAAILVLLLVIARTDYLGSDNETLSRAVELVRSYSKWSFSLGILAILFASNLVFWSRHGFNLVEHLVLATYTHFVVLVISILNMAPLLLGASPQTVAIHRAASATYMGWVEAAVVCVAFGQFFAIRWWQQWWWPALGALVFFVAKQGLFYVYARAVIRIVMAQVS